jgi:hypothetical protein
MGYDRAGESLLYSLDLTDFLDIYKVKQQRKEKKIRQMIEQSEIHNLSQEPLVTANASPPNSIHSEILSIGRRIFENISTSPTMIPDFFDTVVHKLPHVHKIAQRGGK